MLFGKAEREYQIFVVGWVSICHSMFIKLYIYFFLAWVSGSVAPAIENWLFTRTLLFIAFSVWNFSYVFFVDLLICIISSFVLVFSYVFFSRILLLYIRAIYFLISL